MKDLGTIKTEYIGPLQIPIETPIPFKSNNKKECLDCNIEITAMNDSGWEGFCEDGTTQPMCKKCSRIRSKITEKAGVVENDNYV